MMRKIVSDIIVTLGALGAISILMATSPQEPIFREVVHAVSAWGVIAVLWFWCVRGQV